MLEEINSSKILIVYDSKVISETISISGGKTPKRIIEINSPENTLETIKKESPAICLLCAVTGKTKAFEICKKIKSNSNYAKTIVTILALNDTAEMQKKSKIYGADTCLNIATPIDEMIKKINTLANPKLQKSPAQKKLSIEELTSRLEQAEKRISQLEKELKIKVL